MKNIQSILFVVVVMAFASVPATARYYDPATGRFLSEDPIFHAGRSSYEYALSNPLKYVDPLGLYAQVIIWQPVGWGMSSFGHVSVDINGMTYTYGPRTANGPNTIQPIATSSYINMNQFRQGIGLELNLTTSEEQEFEAFLKGYNKSYSFPNNACGAPTRQGLSQLGRNGGLSPLPAGIGLYLIESGLVSGYQFYNPATPAKRGAPWAR